MLNFDFLEKYLGLVSSKYPVYYFSKKSFVMPYISNEQISLTDCLYCLY